MQTVWKDYIDVRDLQNVKERMTAVEEVLRSLQDEMDHIEGEHCRERKQPPQEHGRNPKGVSKER